MRTTLNIDDVLYRKIKSKAALEGKKVTELIQEGLELVLLDHSELKKQTDKRVTVELPILDLSKGKRLFQGLTTQQYLEHLKNLEFNEK